MFEANSKKLVGTITFGLLSLSVVLVSQISKAEAAKPSSSTTPAAPAPAAPAAAAQILSTTSFSAAGVNTYNQSNKPLAASALFNYLNNGMLSVTLTNTASKGVSDPSDVLTSLFWDYAGSPLNLVLASANAPTVVNTSSTVGSNVNLLNTSDSGKEWSFASSSAGLTGVSQHYGIGTAGLGIFQGIGGQKQVNYGIVNGFYNPNGGLSGNFVQSSATFLFSGLTNGFDITKIGNVRFQYGTNLAEANITPAPAPAPAPAPGSTYYQPTPKPKKIPEPSTTVALGLFLVTTVKALKEKALKEE